MSLARIDVQQLAPDRWVVELECGSYSKRRRTLLRGRTFGETMAAVERAYREQVEEPLALKPSERLPEPVAVGEVGLSGRERITAEQLAEAESLGVWLDRRWSRVRAQEAIDRKLAE